MVLACPECKSPIARQGQRYCYRCGNDLTSYYQSVNIDIEGGAVLAADPAPTGGSGPVATDGDNPDQPYSDSSGETALDDTMSSPSPDVPSPRKATLRIVLPTGDVFDREVARSEIQMGKGPRNDIVIADPAVSSSHALLRFENGEYVIADLGSRNGTFVNGERITQIRPLRHGDVIGLGLSKLTFRFADYGETESIEIPESLRKPAGPPPLTEDSLAGAVVREGFASAEQVARLRDESRGRRLLLALSEDNIVPEEQMCELASRLFQIPRIDLDKAKPDEALVVQLKPQFAREAGVLPLSVEAGKLILVMADPTDTGAAERVSTEMNLPVELRVATAASIRQVISDLLGPKLIGVLPSGEKVEYAVNARELAIGKASHNEIVLTDPTVSNTHAVVLERDDRYCIVDMSSRNGTFVNGERLGTEAKPLLHGDSIQLGQSVLTFRDPAASSANVTEILSADALEEVRKRAIAVESNRSKPPVTDAPEATTEEAPVAAAAAGDVEAIAGETDEEKGDEKSEEKKKKKKKKKGKDDRIRAAYVGAISRVLAQILGVALTASLAIYVTQLTFRDSGRSADSQTAARSVFAAPSATTSIQGGNFEPSGVVFMSGSEGVLFVDDNHPGEVYWMRIDGQGLQVGPPKSVSLGVSVQDPEGIVYGGGFVYVVGSQSDAGWGERNALARFTFDPSTENLRGPAEVVPDLRSFLLANVPELKGEGERPGERGGLNVEGIAWDPAHERLLLGLRSPLVNGLALVVPLQLRDPRGPFTIENLQVSEAHAIQLPLGGQGIRAIQYDGMLKSFLLITGSAENQERSEFKLWQWNGDANQANPGARPKEELVLDGSIKPEGLTRVSLSGRAFVFVVGDANSYFRIDYQNAQ